MSARSRPGPDPRRLPERVAVNHGLQVTVFILLFGVAIPAIALQEIVTTGWESRLVLIVVAMVVGPPAWVFLAEARFRLSVGPEGLEARSLFGERRDLPWSAIHRVEFGSITRTLIFHARIDGEPVLLRVSLMRRRIDALGRAIPAYLPEEAYREAWEEMFGRTSRSSGR